MTRRWQAALLALLLAGRCAMAFGASLAELEAAGRVRIDSALAPTAGIVPGQRVALTLEIATDTWFTGGTRIHIPEVAGLVIVQSEQFATNASETREGRSWVIQRWTLDIFPQRAGEFTLGPIAVDVRVNAGDGDAAGTLRSPARRFSVALPDSLAQVQQWVAAPAFSVSQRFDRPLEQLAVGDAFEQEIRFEATDVMAMMLPDYPAPHLAGLAAYPAPPVLETSVNRGQAAASRSVRISYVVERPGAFLLPARDFYWWNTQRGELAVLSVPESRIEVAGETAAQRVRPGMASLKPGHWLALALAAALALLAVHAARRGLPPSLARRLSAAAQHLRRLLRPALPARLNPGSSDAE